MLYYEVIFIDAIKNNSFMIKMINYSALKLKEMVCIGCFPGYSESILQYKIRNQTGCPKRPNTRRRTINTHVKISS